jgi:hypothetical protein
LIKDSGIDLNGVELILDADGNTTITADTDDQIDFKIAGADDFRMTANTLSVLSGTTLNIDSGATIANSGTATGFADLTAIADGSAGSPSIANSGDTNTGIYFPAADTVGVVTGGTEQFRFGSNPIPGGNKNLVQNGNFTVAQRPTATSPGNGVYFPTDRWKSWQSTAGAVTVTQDSDGIFAAWGTDFSLKLDVTTVDSSVASGDRFVVAHPIEAGNLQHLKYGLAGAEAITVSFCFRSPKSGTHYVAIYQADGNRYIWRPFTVASADTAEHFSLTFAADTGGLINGDNGIGLFLYFPLMAGSNFEAGSDNTWADGEKYGAATIQNLLDNTSNNIYIGLVQLEVGSVATDFAHEDIGTTLQKCQRYFERIGNVAQYVKLGEGHVASASVIYASFGWFVEKRAAPTMSKNGTLNCNVFSGTAGTTAAFSFQNKFRGYVEISGGNSMTGGQAATLQTADAATDYIDVSAEL